MSCGFILYQESSHFEAFIEASLTIFSAEEVAQIANWDHPSQNQTDMTIFSP